MTLERLYLDSEVPGYVVAAGDPARMVGNDIAVLADGVVPAGRFYHVGQGCPDPDVHTWSLWRAGQAMVTQDVDVAPTFVGWVEFDLAAPVQVSAAADYTVTVCYATGAAYGYSIRMAPSDTAEHVDLGRGLSLDAPCGTFPTTPGPVYVNFVDLIYQEGVAVPVLTARQDLAARLAAVAPDTVTVVDAPPRNAAPPFLAIGAGSPYRRPSAVPGCIEEWRLDVWCAVSREAINALDDQDALIDLVRQAVDGMPYGIWLGVDRANVAADDLAGVPYLAAIAQVRVMV